jgi:uncharacterized protein (UPF0276 family)
MMKFAVNYSKQAAQLVEQGVIEIDRFKCPDWPDLIAEASRLRPVAVHFTLNVGQGKIQSTNWGQIERILQQTGTDYVNLHLAPEYSDFPGIPVDTTDNAECQIVIQRMIAEVQSVVSRFGSERVIVENVPYRGEDRTVMRPGVEPDAISEVVRETNCGLLLDISHARIAARSLGIDERLYMAALPVHRLREMHFTGLHHLDGRWQDHFPVLEEDWPALDWALERVRNQDWAHPNTLAFEYGGVGEKFAWRSDPTVIAEQVPRLYQSVHAV